ncbi:MAG: histidine kinase [Salinibacter sp.]
MSRVLFWSDQSASPSRRWTMAGLHLTGWLLYGIVYHLTLQPHQPVTAILWKQTAIATGTGLALSTGLGAAYGRLSVRQLSPVGEVSTALVGSVAVGLLWYQLKAWGADWVNPFIAPVTATGAFRPGDGSLLSSAPAFPVVMLMWSGFYLTLAHWQAAQEEERRRLQADAEAQRARLRMLRYQLNPHFFFNALTTIGALADENPQRVKTAVRELSGFLRYTLLDDDSLAAPLRDEIQAAEHYLAVEKIRFEDDLQVAFDVSETAGQQVVPSFLVLPLVENTIKHGQRTSPEPLRVRIHGTVADDVLRIMVANTGHWRNSTPDTTGTGTGLDNVRTRLEAQYPDQHRFEIWEEDGWVRARIALDADALTAHA